MKLDKSGKENELLQQKILQLDDDVIKLKEENKKRRKMIQQQQMLIEAGASSYYQVCVQLPFFMMLDGGLI